MSRKITDDIRTILQSSRHAPSSHNTQPWKVNVNGSSVAVGFSPERQLNVGDPEKRELYISLGCFIESFVLSAEELGYKVKAEFIGNEPLLIVRLGLAKGSTSGGVGWAKLIAVRRSDRRFYEPMELNAKTIDSLASISGKDASVRIFSDKKTIDFLSGETYSATYKTMLNPAFRAELASWVRNNWTKKHDGMPGYTQGIPGPVSLLAKLVLKKNKGVAKVQAKKDSQRLLHSEAVGLICAHKQSPAAWIEAGRLYQRACLIALKDGVKSSGVSAAIIDPETTKKITKELNLAGNPVALLRFGYTKNSPKASPRLTLSHFVTEK